MFVLSSASQFYTGRAGDAWTSANVAEAFSYASRAEAERKAALFNRSTVLHGLTFSVEAR